MATDQELLAELNQLEAEYAAKTGATEVSSITNEPTDYSLGQFAFDVPIGVAKAGAGLGDLLSMALDPYAATRAMVQGEERPTFTGLIERGAKAVAPMLGVQPKTEMQRAVEFVTPLPGPGKARLAADALMGLASYGGTRAAEAIAPESKYAGLVGALLAPAGISASKAALQSLPTNVGVLAGREQTLKQLAEQEVVQALGEEGIARLATAQTALEPGAKLVSGLGQPLTVAEIALTPSMGKYQQAIRQTQEGGNIIEPIVQEREKAIELAKAGLGKVPQQGDLATLLRNEAAKSVKQKETQDALVLEKLAGSASPLLRETSVERGEVLQQGLLKAKEPAKDVTKEMWRKVPENLAVDATYALNMAEKRFNEFDPLIKSQLSPTGKTLIEEVNNLLQTKDGIIDVKKLQALRETAGIAQKEASGKLPREAMLMREFKDELDVIGVEQILTKSADAPKTAIEKLKEAIKSTAEFKQKFEKGVTGEITGVRQFEPVVKASQAIKLAIRNPENAEELIGKFGRNSEAGVALRAELLANLNNVKDPIKELTTKKRLYQNVFRDDFAKIETFAKQKASDAPLEEFRNVTDSTIPTTIFADEQKAKKFMETFKNTQIADFAKGRFVKEQIFNSATPSANIAQKEKIAKQLFKKQLPTLKLIAQDLELSKMPEALSRSAAKGQSITSQMNTTLGAIANGRALLKLMRTSPALTAAAGGALGLSQATSELVLGVLLGSNIGSYANSLANAREAKINQFAAELLVNPQMIKLAGAPATEENIKALLEYGARLGYLGSKAVPDEMPTE